MVNTPFSRTIFAAKPVQDLLYKCDKEAQGADVAKKHFKIQNPCKHLWEVLPLMSHRGSDLALISETHEDNIKPFHWKTESFIWG